MQSQQLNYEDARNDHYVMSFVNALQNELPAGYHLDISNGDNNERPRISIYTTQNTPFTLMFPIFQIDSDYNLYNIDTEAGDDATVDMAQSNGANIRSMIINPYTTETTNSWASVRDHVEHELQAGHFHGTSQSTSNDADFDLKDGYFNGKRLT